MALEKLLITGASGVIGKVLAPKLAESYDVYSEVRNEESCGDINLACSGNAAFCGGHRQGAAAEEDTARPVSVMDYRLARVDK